MQPDAVEGFGFSSSLAHAWTVALPSRRRLAFRMACAARNHETGDVGNVPWHRREGRGGSALPGLVLYC